MKLTNKAMSFFDFFESLDKQGQTLVIPSMQRPPVWSSGKILGIISNQEVQYFGAITIMNKKGKLMVLDGQQRITSFLMMYKLVEEIGTEKILDSENVEESKRPFLGYIFGSKCSSDTLMNLDVNDGIKSEVHLLTEYVDNMNLLIKNFDDAIFRNLLKNTYINVDVVSSELGNSKISEYDIFTSINSDGTKLANSDLIKTFYLKKYNQKNSPIDINNTWRKMLLSIYSANLKDIDSLIVRYLMSKGTNTTKPQIFKVIKNDFSAKFPEQKEMLTKKEIISSERKSNKFIKEEVGNLKKYVMEYSAPISFKDEESSIPTLFKDYKNAFMKFIYSSGLYKPFESKAINISSKIKKADDFRNMISSCFKLLYAKEFNLSIQKYKEENIGVATEIEKAMANKIRQKTVKYLNKNVEEYIENVLDYKPFFIEEAFNNFISLISRHLKKPAYGKSLWVLIEWYISGEDEFFEYKNSFTLEHVIQSIIIKNKSGSSLKVSDKNLANSLVVLLEKDYHKSLDDEISKSLKTWDSKKTALIGLSDIKKRYYSKSKSSFTKIFLSDLSPTKLNGIALRKQYMISFFKSETLPHKKKLYNW